MHNLHFIAINAISAQQACEKVDLKFNGHKNLDFSKLDVNPDHFRELENPYDDEEYDSFATYLTELLNLDDPWSIRDLEHELDGETYFKIDKFLQTAGYDVDLDDNLFNITVLGAMNEDETDKHFQNSGHWDFNEYSKSDIDKILSNEFGKEVNCFGDNQWIDDTPADSVRIRDQFAKDSTLPKYVVMLDVRS
tara:strand:- start:181 stop:759 length:579 start_codon:yes stop_codon:yes gene_type:complete